jgi:hypothetical protein
MVRLFLKKSHGWAEAVDDRPMLLRTTLIVGALLLVFPAAASAQADVEAVWEFTGGQVAIQPAGDGSFRGTVIRETRFSDCVHAVGEVMWLGMRSQPDGQYFGGHQWFRTSDCAPLPDRGNTAFRVLVRPDGTRFLRVCFAAPERPDLQPTIAADGTSANTTVSCNDSDFVAPPAAPPRFVDVVRLPAPQGRRRCVSRRNFRIRLREPRGDALASATVFVNGKRVKAVRGERLTARVDLRGLPKGRYTVRIVAKTVLGRTIQGKRRYRTCVPSKRRPRG